MTATIDVLASLARTALTDPDGLDVDEHRRVYSPSGTTFLAEAPSGSAAGYAVDRLDEIINVLNPSEATAATLHDALEAVGNLLIQIRDRARAEAEEDVCASELHYALEHIDSALALLT